MDRFELIQSLAKQAGNAIKNIHPKTSVSDKDGRGNFVTEADKKSEEILINGISTYFPTDTILSEETASTLSTDELLHLPNLWVIDPLDGTADFRYERNHCAVSIGYIEHGKVLHGAVYNPFMNEWYVASKGKGAFRNEKIITVGTQTDITKSTVYTTNAYEPEQTTKHLEMLLKIQPSPWILIRGSAALQLCEIASGQADLCFSTVLRPWDVAGSYIILEEAGADIKDMTNNPVSFLTSHIVTGNQTLVQQFLSIVS